MLWNNKLCFVFLFVMLISGCEKKNTSVNIQTDTFSSEISEINKEAEEENVVYDDSIDKIVFNNQLTSGENTVLIDFSEIYITNFLSNIFREEEYRILDEPLDVNYRKIYFAVHYIMESPNIFDVAVGFEIMDESVIPYLYIKDFKFIDKNNTVFIDLSKGYAGIYGFNFLFSYPKVEGYTPGLNIETYFDSGKRIADSFGISWNEEIMTFEDDI